jgi:hypothetical protein
VGGSAAVEGVTETEVLGALSYAPVRVMARSSTATPFSRPVIVAVVTVPTVDASDHEEPPSTLISTR